tara:strand:+ start:147 stop:1352 length:1206 start_codon:yes stop_codon:yes gene_type:complete
MDLPIDHTKCQSYRSIKKGNFLQCSNRKCLNSDFCGVHKNAKYKVTQPLPSNIIDKYGKKTKLLISISKKNEKNTKHCGKKKKPKIITYNNILESMSNKPNSKVYVADIRHTLNNFKLNSLGSKREVFARLKSFYNKLVIFEKNIENLKKLQRNVRNKIKYNNNKYKGIGFYDRTLCNNQEDFYTLNNLNTIPDEYFFSYTDVDKFVYGFDIRSLIMLVKSSTQCLNPYNRKVIPTKAIEYMDKRIKQMSQRNISIVYEDNTEYTPEQKMMFRVTEVFQKIDECNVAAGGTNVNWFLNLSIINLKIFYKELEDIWNYRAELTIDAKERIVPGRDIFRVKIGQMYQIMNYQKIRYYILDEIEKLVTKGLTSEDRNIGALWVLSALVIVSPSCAESLPWLIYV